MQINGSLVLVECCNLDVPLSSALGSIASARVQDDDVRSGLTS